MWDQHLISLGPNELAFLCSMLASLYEHVGTLRFTPVRHRWFAVGMLGSLSDTTRFVATLAEALPSFPK